MDRETMDRFCLLAAFQVLSMPGGAYAARHADARRMIYLATGKAPTSQPPVGLGPNEYLAWLTEHHVLELGEEAE